MTNLEKCVSLTKKGHSELYLCTKDPINSVKLETSGIVSCFVLPTIVEPLLSCHLLMATPFRWLIIKVPMGAFLLFLLLYRQALLSGHYPFPPRWPFNRVSTAVVIEINIVTAFNCYGI